MRPTGLPPRQQPRLFEHFHMLGRAGEAHREGPGELADRFFAECQVGEHPAPGRVSQRAENGVESLFNHAVELRLDNAIVNRLV